MHLAKYIHDVVDQVTEIWCGAPEWKNSDATANVEKVDCNDCLLSALDFAEEVRERRGELLAAKEQPGCECRAGSHPARENYLKGAAERDGAICKLGWPL